MIYLLIISFAFAILILAAYFFHHAYHTLNETKPSFVSSFLLATDFVLVIVCLGMVGSIILQNYSP